MKLTKTRLKQIIKEEIEEAVQPQDLGLEMSTGESGGVGIEGLYQLIAALESGERELSGEETAALVKILRNTAQNIHNKGIQRGTYKRGGTYDRAGKDFSRAASAIKPR